MRVDKNILNFSNRVISVIVAIICMIAIAAFLLTDIIPFSDISSAMAYVLVAGIISVLYWGFRPHKFEKKSTDYKINQVEPTDHDTPMIKSVELPNKVLRKNIKLRIDEYEDKKLDLKRGIEITGEISSDGFFNVYFLTESSYRSFKNDYNFQYLEGAEDVSHFEPHFEVQRRGNYYFVVENADKKNIVVNIELNKN